MGEKLQTLSRQQHLLLHSVQDVAYWYTSVPHALGIDVDGHCPVGAISVAQLQLQMNVLTTLYLGLLV